MTAPPPRLPPPPSPRSFWPPIPPPPAKPPRSTSPPLCASRSRSPAWLPACRSAPTSSTPTRSPWARPSPAASSSDPSERSGIVAGVNRLPDTVSERLREPLGQVERRREDLAKEWLIAVIRESELAEVERLPVNWAAKELPELITDLLVAVYEGAEPVLGSATLERAR